METVFVLLVYGAIACGCLAVMLHSVLVFAVACRELKEEWQKWT